MKLKSKMIYKATGLVLFFMICMCNSSFASAKCVYYKNIQIKSTNSGNVISWTTSQEQDLRIFVIQRSTNGGEFRRVGDVRGSGFSKSKKKYRFLDLGAKFKNTKYRLLHYASDGTYTVSKIFTSGQKAKNSWSVSPQKNDRSNSTLKVNNKQNYNAALRSLTRLSIINEEVA